MFGVNHVYYILRAMRVKLNETLLSGTSIGTFYGLLSMRKFLKLAPTGQIFPY